MEQAVLSSLWFTGAGEHIYQKPQQSEPRGCGGEPPNSTPATLYPNRESPSREDTFSD